MPILCCPAWSSPQPPRAPQRGATWMRTRQPRGAWPRWRAQRAAWGPWRHRPPPPAARTSTCATRSESEGWSGVGAAGGMPLQRRWEVSRCWETISSTVLPMIAQPPTQAARLFGRIRQTVACQAAPATLKSAFLEPVRGQTAGVLTGWACLCMGCCVGRLLPHPAELSKGVSSPSVPPPASSCLPRRWRPSCLLSLRWRCAGARTRSSWACSRVRRRGA